jgi:hypothetical protein
VLDILGCVGLRCWTFYNGGEGKNININNWSEDQQGCTGQRSYLRKFCERKMVEIHNKLEKTEESYEFVDFRTLRV